MTIADMTQDMVRACALKCPITLPKTNGRVTIESGDWFAYPAKTEATKRFRKACVNDLRDREMRGGSYPGDVGRVMIGGKRFALYQKCGMLVREDFANWVDANWNRVLKADGTERESTRPLRQEDVEPMPINRHSLEAKERAKGLHRPTELIHADQQNALYDMKLMLQRYADEIKADQEAGSYCIVTKIQADLLAAMVADRERSYARAVDCFLWVAAAALKAAEWEAEEHAKTTGNTGG